MNAMKKCLLGVVAAAVLMPLQGAQAWSDGPYHENEARQSYRIRDRGSDDGDYRGRYRGPRGGYGRFGHHRHHHHYRHPGYYWGRWHDYGPGYHSRPWIGYRGPVMAPPPPPPLPRW